MRLIILIGLAAVIIAGCSNESVPGSKEPIGAAVPATNRNAVDRIEQDLSPSEPPVFVIDVRSREEWDTGHVQQAILIPHTEIADRIAEVTTDKNARIVLYCAVGGRAGKAQAVLESLGYTAVENGGGYDDVKDQYK